MTLILIKLILNIRHEKFFPNKIYKVTELHFNTDLIFFNGNLKKKIKQLTKLKKQNRKVRVMCNVEYFL